MKSKPDLDKEPNPQGGRYHAYGKSGNKIQLEPKKVLEAVIERKIKDGGRNLS